MDVRNITVAQETGAVGPVMASIAPLPDSAGQRGVM